MAIVARSTDRDTDRDTVQWNLTRGGVTIASGTTPNYVDAFPEALENLGRFPRPWSWADLNDDEWTLCERVFVNPTVVEVREFTITTGPV